MATISKPITQQVLIGNCAEILKTLPDESVDCVVTSPPYWGLRDYKTEPIIWDGDADCEHDFDINTIVKTKHENKDFNERWGNASGDKKQEKCKAISAEVGVCQKCGAWRGQLGLEPTPQLYIAHLTAIFEEVKRVLKEDGTCWVNLGDSYSGSWGNYGSRSGEQRDVTVEQKARRGSFSESFLPPASRCDVAEKSLVQIPSRFAIAMTDAGWILRNEIIWHKPNCMPSSVEDRFTVDFEKMFFFTKSKKYYFEPQLEVGIKPKGRVEKVDTGKRFGEHGPDASSANRNGRTYTYTGKRNKRCVWAIATKPYGGAHFAVFPSELVATPIKAGCPPGGVVLDPFGGSGTTSEVARGLGRSSIIIELNPDYLNLIKERARTDVPDVLSFEEVA